MHTSWELVSLPAIGPQLLTLRRVCKINQQVVLKVHTGFEAREVYSGEQDELAPASDWLWCGVQSKLLSVPRSRVMIQSQDIPLNLSICSHCTLEANEG